MKQIYCFIISLVLADITPITLDSPCAQGTENNCEYDLSCVGPISDMNSTAAPDQYICVKFETCCDLNKPYTPSLSAN